MPASRDAEHGDWLFRGGGKFRHPLARDEFPRCGEAVVSDHRPGGCGREAIVDVVDREAGVAEKRCFVGERAAKVFLGSPSAAVYQEDLRRRGGDFAGRQEKIAGLLRRGAIRNGGARGEGKEQEWCEVGKLVVHCSPLVVVLLYQRGASRSLYYCIDCRRAVLV